MSQKTRAISAAIAGVCAIVINLLVEWFLNHKLAADDYIISLALGALTALAIFFLFRNRSR